MFLRGDRDGVAGRPLRHLALRFVSVHLDPRDRLRAAEVLERGPHLLLLAAALGHLDLVARADPVGRDVHRTSVDLDVPVSHELACLAARRREAHAVNDVIQPALERHQQRLARDPGLLQHAVEDVAELLLRKAIDALDLLLLAQLLGVFGRLAPAAGRLAVLARGVGAALNGALLRETARALQEQLRALAAAQPADGTRVARHVRPAASWAAGTRCGESASHRGWSGPASPPSQALGWPTRVPTPAPARARARA